MILLKISRKDPCVSRRIKNQFLLFPRYIAGTGFVWLETVELHQYWGYLGWVNIERRRISREGPTGVPGAHGLPGPAGPAGPRGLRGLPGKCKCAKGKTK